MATVGSHRVLPRTLRTSSSPGVILLIGTPGTGKRALGHFLAEENGFVHLDFENAGTRDGLLGLSTTELRARLAGLAECSGGVVITWGAGGNDQLCEIRRLRRAGAKPIWLDSDRGAACRAHFAGARRPGRFHFVDSFEEDGSFRPVGAVAAELLASTRTPPPAPRRVTVLRRAGEIRGRSTNALAFLAGAAAATAAVLVATGGGGAPRPQPALAGQANRPATMHHVAALPRQGVLVNGTSLAGVQLGDTTAKVRALWGGRFTRCRECKPAMWFYLYPPPDDPVGAGVQFERGKVVAVFTLGSPSGWHTESGIRVGQILANPYNGPSKDTWLSCAGYGAQTTRSSKSAVTSILTQGAAVYGFALTRPSISPCH